MKNMEFGKMIRRAAALGLAGVMLCSTGLAAAPAPFISPKLAENGGSAMIETRPGSEESIGVNVAKNASGGVTHISGRAAEVDSQTGMIVSFDSDASLTLDPIHGYVGTEQTKYTVASHAADYWAEGGSMVTASRKAPLREIHIALTDKDDPNTKQDDRKNALQGGHAGMVKTTGDVRKFPSDGSYDYRVYTIYEQGDLSVTTHGIQINELITSDFNENMSYVTSSLTKSGEDLLGPASSVVIPRNKNEVPAITEGYDHVYLGSDVWSRFWLSYAFMEPDNSVYAGEDGKGEQPINPQPIISGGKPVNFYLRRAHAGMKNLSVPRIYLPDVVTEGSFPSIYDSVQQYILCDANGKIITTYCADQKTRSIEGHSYVMKNVADANYYSEEEAQMIRTVARKGYWGTDSGLGSMANFKQMLSESGKFTQSEIDAVTPGVAMTATQFSIWHFSNVMNEMTFINAFDATKRNSYGRPKNPAPKDKADLIFKIYYHMIGLEPAANDKAVRTTLNTIINEKNFVEDVIVKLNAKPEERKENLDAETGNDVYLADLSFTLKVKPDAKRDDLVLRIKNKKGDTLAVGRIAGGLKSGESKVDYDAASGRYMFDGVELEEGGKNLIFEMSGSQVLDKDVYLFTSEEKYAKLSDMEGILPSQTMIGVAEGERKVMVKMDILFELDVNDELSAHARYWRKEKGVPTPKDPPPPGFPPETGDASMLTLWLALLMIGGTGAVVIRRRRKAQA